MENEFILNQLKFMMESVAQNQEMETHYKAGLYNGLELAISKIENREPNFLDVNKITYQQVNKED
jgi:hypothetical protein